MHFYYSNEAFARLVGAKVMETFVTGSDEVRLILSDGRLVDLTLTGDCCSKSNFTDPKQFEELVGATILEAEDRQGHSSNNLPEPEGADSISWHFLVFKTNKGHVTIDWHNDSNGYYDGNLKVVIH